MNSTINGSTHWLTFEMSVTVFWSGSCSSPIAGCRDNGSFYKRTAVRGNMDLDILLVIEFEVIGRL